MRYNEHPIKATLPSADTSNAMQPSGNKEVVCDLTAIVTYKGEVKEPITLRMWMGRSSNANRVTACVWSTAVAARDGQVDTAIAA
jgi:hypothetical protein